MMANDISEDAFASVAYFKTVHFDKSVRSASMRGPTRRHVDRAMAAVGRVGSGDPFLGLAVTNHGERRIPNCVKYDLGYGWRLVTQQTERSCVFVIVGDHDDIDRWLDNNRGFQTGVRDRRAVIVPGTTGDAAPKSVSRHAGQRLLERLESELADYLLVGVPARAGMALFALDGLSRADEIEMSISVIGDMEKRDLLRAVLVLLMEGNVEGAEDRVRLAAGLLTPMHEIAPEMIMDVQDGSGIRRIVIGSADYEAWALATEAASRWQDWHLYLHPEQERVFKEDFTGAAQLSGVSGSGKTCVIVRRAIRLAEAAGSRVLVLTLNRSLAGMLGKLVDAACGDEAARQRITVLSYFDMARALLARFEPAAARCYDDVTWKLGEHVDEIYREFYRCWLNNDDASVLWAQHGSMLARRVAGEAYMREEFDWIRSVFPPDQRTQYLDIERKGRKFPITRERRQDILIGLAAWEDKMRSVGVVDYLGVTAALAPFLDNISPEYTNILLDEAQDFGSTELAVVRNLTMKGVNDLFLCGDVAQTILPKHRSLAAAGIVEVAARSIRRNYRNSREILAAAHDVLMKNLNEEMLHAGDLEILDPRFANFGGMPPLALAASDLEEEIALARAYATEKLVREQIRTACIAFAGYSQRDVACFARDRHMAVLDGRWDPLEERLVLSDLEQTKGYEFDLLVIVNCRDGVLPAADAPPEESYRETCRLYVAITRARHELVLSYHGEASPWIRDIDESILAFPWSDVQKGPVQREGVPERLPEVETVGLRELDLDGRSFLYTKGAVGLSLEAQDKIVELVDGRGLRPSGRGRTKWRSMSSLSEDMSVSRRPDGLFGPVVGAEVRKLLSSD